MENLIKDIFKEYHYVPMEEDNRIFKFQLSDKSKADFYICCTCDESEDLKKVSDRVEEQFANDAYYSIDKIDPTVAKNTSIIYLVKVNNVADYEEKNLNKIYDIEESPYFLKKYVLVYDPDQVQQFIVYKSESDSFGQLSNIEKMAVIISDNDFYVESGKKNQEHSLYSFVLKLYAKLPFTIYDVTPEPRIDETLKSIEDKIIEESDALITKLYSRYNGVLWNKEDLTPLATEIEITEEEIDEYILRQLNEWEGE